MTGSDPLRPCVTLETEDGAVEATARRILDGSGIAVGADADIVLVLLSCSTTARVARIRAAVERHPDVAVVAAMPPGGGGAAMRRTLSDGVRGIVLDDQMPATLVPTVLAVASGQLVVPPTLRRQLAPPALSFREKQILRLVVDGYTNRQIADALYVAESTVKTHLSSAFGKLDARSRSEAAAMILDPDTEYGPAILGLTAEARRSAA